MGLCLTKRRPEFTLYQTYVSTIPRKGGLVRRCFRSGGAPSVGAGQHAFQKLKRGLLVMVLAGCAVILAGCFGRQLDQGKIGQSSEVELKNRGLVGAAIMSSSVVMVRANGMFEEGVLRKEGPLRMSRLCALDGGNLPLFAGAISGDGRRAAVSMRGLVRVISLDNCRTLAETRLIDSRVGSLAFSPDARSLVLGAFDGKIYRWRFSEALSFHRSPALLFERYVGHGGVVSSVAFHPAGRVFFSADWTGALRAWLRYDEDDYRGRWDVATGSDRFYTEVSVSASAARLSEAIEGMVVSDDGESLLTATRDGTIQVWSVRGFRLRGQIAAHQGQIRSLALDQSGRAAVTCGRDGFVRRWRIVAGVEDEKKRDFVKEGEWYQPEARIVMFARDGAAIVLSDEGAERLVGVTSEPAQKINNER